jgi:hypothetical protein
MHATAMGGGVFQADMFSNHPFSISGSIVAGNAAGGSGVDLVKDPESTLSINYSLIGTGITPTAGGNNVVTNNPQLNSLANNGGPTMTRAPLAGSPAINAGDPSIMFNPAEHDQRGAPFVRVSGGRIDIGAFEVQPIIVPPDLFGDYNLNGVVDAADYIVWRKTLGGMNVPAYSGADGDGDTTIDQDDYVVWRAHFGQTLPPGSGASKESSVQTLQLKANAPAVRSITADNIGESVVPIPMETIFAPAETDAVAARSASFAAIEIRSLWHDSNTRSCGMIDRDQVARSSGDDLRLLLAIDRVGRSPWQDSSVSDDNGNGERSADDEYSENEIDKPLAVALALRWGTRSA